MLLNYCSIEKNRYKYIIMIALYNTLYVIAVNVPFRMTPL